MVEETKVTHDNNGRFYRIKMDLAKEGSEIWDLTPYFKGRVGDNRFGLQVVWTYQGRLLDTTGMKPYIEGNVGNYSFDDKKDLQLAPDAATVSYTGNPSDCQSGGRVTYYFPEQMFPRDGIFKGYIGLLNDRDDSSQPHISGVTVWFRVLPGIAQMGHACDVYISDLDKALQNFKEALRQHNIDYQTQLDSNNAEFQRQVQQVITDARNAYNSQVANSRDAMNALDAEVKANRAELTNINDHLAGVEQQIAIHDIVTIPQHQEDIKNISNAIDERLAHMKTAPTAVENAGDLQQRYPNGADGIFIAADTGHKWLYLDNAWVDCGQYQAIGIGDELIDPIKQQQKVDEENIATNYSLINQNTAQIKENTTDIQSVEGAGQLTYVYITDQNGNRITDQIGRELVGQKWLAVTDKTLTQSDLPADAKAVGDAIAKSNQFDATKYGIPVLYLYGDRITSLKDKNGSLKNEVQYNFPKYHIKGTCTNFKVQGASSATLPKKNWTLNLDQSIEIFHGYGKQHKYVVKANMTDFSQSRNVVSAKIWGQIANSKIKIEDVLQDDKGNYMTDDKGNHIIFNADPQLSIGGNYGAVDGFPIVIYVNDKYWGLYSFNIPKDDWMAKMPKEQGYAILDAVWSPQGGFNAETNLNDGLEVQFSGTENTDWIKTSINKLIDVCLAHYDTKEAFDAAVSNLIDINNAIDYLLYSVFIDNTDGVYRNYLLQTFNGTKWYLVPYDLDETYGRTPQTWRYLSPDDDGQNPYLNGVNLNSLSANNRLFYQLIKFHRDDINARYKELVSSDMSVGSLLDSFNNYLSGISKALTDQEVKTWPQTSETQTNNFSQIRWWYDRRINWLNQVFSTTDVKQA